MKSVDSICSFIMRLLGMLQCANTVVFGKNHGFKLHTCGQPARANLKILRFARAIDFFGVICYMLSLWRSIVCFASIYYLFTLTSTC